MIVNGYDQYENLKSRMMSEEHILTPIFRDVFYHPQENQLLCVGVMFANRDSYVLSITHDDATKFELPESIKCFTYHSKNVKFKAWDIAAIGYLIGKEVPPPELMYSPYINETHNLFNNIPDVNKVIPLTVWSGFLREYNETLWSYLEESVNTGQYENLQDMLDTLKDIESQGLAIDREKMVEQFGKKVARTFRNNIVYSEYNPYTTTGRPSNRFGGINFSALNKSDGSRDIFISRYPEGELVQLDFEAYHLRLVANELGVTLPSWKSIHRGLASIYFDTANITEEMYAASKSKTFEIMYGMTDETFGFELFEKIKAERSKYDYRSDITLPSGMTIKVDSPNASKLFNYYVQSLEVVRTMPKLKAICELLKNTNNHLILYTYDSILLDVEKYDTDLIGKVIEILEENKKFPVRTYRGKNYNSIVETP